MPKLTDDQLQALERKYRPKAIPPCPECGGPLRRGEGDKYACRAALDLLVRGQDLVTANTPAAVKHVRKSYWYMPVTWDEQVAALIQEVRESRLPGHEQLDLVEVDASVAALRAAYAAVTAVMPPPIDEPGFHARYLELVQDAIRGLLRSWDANFEEGARS